MEAFLIFVAPYVVLFAGITGAIFWLSRIRNWS